jgi:trehalose 6-phosphate phosphatase
MTSVNPVRHSDIGLFLDFDGTLVDFAPTPAEVLVGPRLVALLTELAIKLRGSVAVITGRSIDSIDQLLRPLRLPVAGLHGLERRSSDGTLYRANTAAWIAATRLALTKHVERHPGLWLEDKTLALTVHYRQAPQHERATCDLMTCMTTNLAGAAQLQAGPASLEIRPPDHGKGGAVAQFLREAPFCGREPVYIGDDETDLPAMRVAEAHRGIAIAVGPRISASMQFPDPTALLDWLQDL